MMFKIKAISVCSAVKFVDSPVQVSVYIHVSIQGVVMRASWRRLRTCRQNQKSSKNTNQQRWRGYWHHMEQRTRPVEVAVRAKSWQTLNTTRQRQRVPRSAKRAWRVVRETKKIRPRATKYVTTVETTPQKHLQVTA